MGHESNVGFCWITTYLPTYLPTNQSASCISALAAWLVRILQTVRSWAATSASSTIQPNPRLRRSLWMTSIHFVLGRPRLRLPWDGFHRCSLFGIRLLSIRSRYPNHFSLRFLIKLVSWGCLVTDRISLISWGCLVTGLISLLVTCWDHLIRKILRWHPMSKALSLASSLSVRLQISTWYLGWYTSLFRPCLILWMCPMLYLSYGWFL